MKRNEKINKKPDFKTLKKKFQNRTSLPCLIDITPEYID